MTVSPPRGQGGIVEPLVAFFVATAAASALYWVGRVVPFVGQNLHAAIAVLFFYIPSIAARITGRPFDYRTAGFRADPVGLNLAVVSVGVLVTWPIFFAAFFFFYTYVCGLAGSPVVAWWTEVFAPLCGRFTGLEGAGLRLPPDFLLLALSQIVVIALPEELFFRGYLWNRLEERWPATRRFLGAPVGKTLLATSGLFAVGHVLVDFDVQRLAVFFPALVFGWMRARTGSILPGVLFHALCNLFSDTLYTSFFRVP